MEETLISFSLNGREVGIAQVPSSLFKRNRWLDRPMSHHYVCPFTGKVWASVEVEGAEWSTWMIPSPNAGSRNSLSRSPGELKLDWLLGATVYQEVELLNLLPLEILRSEFTNQYDNMKACYDN